jgi:negative regulator of replication initiation
MVTTKPIKVDDEVKKLLDKKKIHPRETYNDVLRRILELQEKTEKKENV